VGGEGGREEGFLYRVECDNEDGPTVAAEGVPEDGGHDAVPVGDVEGGGGGGGGGGVGGATRQAGPAGASLVFFILSAGCVVWR